MSDQAPPPPPPPEENGEQPPVYGQPPAGGYGAPPPAYGQQPQFGQPHGAPAAVTGNKATWALVLGILSLVCCGLFTGIPAIIMGKNAKAELEAAGQSGSTANIGMILGIVGTALSVLGLLFFLLVAGGMSTGG